MRITHIPGVLLHIPAFQSTVYNNGCVSVPFTPINSNWSHVYLPNAIPIHSQYIPSQDTNECMIDENEPYHFKVLLCVAVRTTWRTVHSLQIIDPYTLPLVTIHTQLESAQSYRLWIWSRIYRVDLHIRGGKDGVAILNWRKTLIEIGITL
eukprot:156035_1